MIIHAQLFPGDHVRFSLGQVVWRIERLRAAENGNLKAGVSYVENGPSYMAPGQTSVGAVSDITSVRYGGVGEWLKLVRISHPPGLVEYQTEDLA